jgi:hypothetical protein
MDLKYACVQAINMADDFYGCRIAASVNRKA